MNKFSGIFYCLIQMTEIFFPICIEFHLIVFCIHCFRSCQIIHDKIMISGKLSIILKNLFALCFLLLFYHRRLQCIFQFLIFKQFYLSHIPANQKVQKESQHRNKIKHQKPCPNGPRIPAFKKHNGNCQQNINSKSMVSNKLYHR